MKGLSVSMIAACGVIIVGCVSKGMHTQTLAELEAARKASAETAAAFESFKKRAADEHRQLAEERNRIANELLTAQSALNEARQAITKANEDLDHERAERREAEMGVKKLRDDIEEGQRLSGELGRERDLLQVKTEDLQRRLENAEQELASRNKALVEAEARLAALEKERAQIATARAEAQDQARDLEAKLAAERAQIASLREDKQRLMSGTTTAQEEIARLQKRAGELETQAVRVGELEKRIQKQDQEIGQLRQAAADRESLTSKVASLTDELDKAKQRIAALAGDLAKLGDEAARIEQDRDRLAADVQKQRESLSSAEQAQASLTAILSERELELDRLRQGEHRLRAKLQQDEESLKAEEAERARLERERADKEEEIRRLTQTRDDLTKSLQAEIAKGDIRIQQVRDRLTINMLDRVLFDSGQARIKPSGLKVLKQVSEILKKVTDKQIRIEGHTDRVPIGPRLKDRFPTNWELSAARATTVVRYLIEEGGVDRGNLSAVGYGDNRPVAENDTEEGRAANRRIEIVLYPKDLTEIVGQINHVQQ